ncbi:hypothetical protein [Spartinivicinus ruber]|uniref:hypothetical protein n=1 Tax=Spartinivicinus ruber TaxID=2683272 RepID=UPI0013D3A557|nr:hypothetical protein [Spartinivicinus ruber]
MLFSQTAWEYISLNPQQSLFILATIYSVLGGLLGVSVRLRTQSHRQQPVVAMVTSHEEHLPIPRHLDYSTINHTWNRLFTAVAQFCVAMAVISALLGYLFF